MKPTSSRTIKSDRSSGALNLESCKFCCAASRSFTRAAALKKRTFLPCLQAAKASPVAMCVLPHPLKCLPGHHSCPFFSRREDVELDQFVFLLFNNNTLSVNF